MNGSIIVWCYYSELNSCSPFFSIICILFISGIYMALWVVIATDYRIMLFFLSKLSRTRRFFVKCFYYFLKKVALISGLSQSILPLLHWRACFIIPDIADSGFFDMSALCCFILFLMLTLVWPIYDLLAQTDWSWILYCIKLIVIQESWCGQSFIRSVISVGIRLVLIFRVFLFQFFMYEVFKGIEGKKAFAPKLTRYSFSASVVSHIVLT